MHSLEGEALTVAPGSEHRVQIPLRGELAKGDDGEVYFVTSRLHPNHKMDLACA